MGFITLSRKRTYEIHNTMESKAINRNNTQDNYLTNLEII